MNCKEGDLAYIVFSIRPQNIGRVVKVVEYIGKFAEGEEFQFRGMPCKAPVPDYYFWIEADDIEIMLGPSPRAYIADSWLRPIKPPKEERETKEQLELDILA